MKTRLFAGGLTAVMLAGALSLAPISAVQAGRRNEDLWRIGTYLGSAATIYALAKGEDTWALIGGGATLLSYTQWRNAVKDRHRDRSRRAYRRYRTNWLNKHRGHRIHRVRR